MAAIRSIGPAAAISDLVRRGRAGWARLVAVAVLSGVGAGCEPGLSVPTSAVVTLAGGKFVMGSSRDCNDGTGVSCRGDRPPHAVKLSPFGMQTTEVSSIQYESCVLRDGCPDQGAFDARQRNHPMLVDDPEAARSYCRSLSMRLPTEAEFEYAARVNAAGDEFVFPWGRSDATDKPPTCSQLTLAGCNAGSFADVGSAPGDVTATGIHDLAGSAPEWVEDSYAPYVGCAGRLSYADVCYGQSPGCAEARCASDGAQCARGCLPLSEDLSSTGQGGGVVSQPVCALATDDTTPPVDPVVRTPTGFAVVRGGGPSDGACSFAGFTRRHVVPHRDRAGFRCVRGDDTSAPLHVLTSYRFTPSGCQMAAKSVKLSITSTATATVIYNVDAYPSAGGAASSFGAVNGVVDGLPCAAVFEVHPSLSIPLDIDLRSTDGTTCLAGTRKVDLSGGGDVPAVGIDQVPLTAPCR